MSPAGMSDIERTLRFLDLSLGATPSEIDRAFSERTASARRRLEAGDESARLELVVLKEARERLGGRGSGRPSGKPATREHPVVPYISLLLAVGALGSLIVVIAFLPSIYRDGGFLVPLGLLVLSGLLSIAATMAAEAEMKTGMRLRLLGRRGLAATDFPGARWQVARASSLIGLIVRWSLIAVLIAVVLLNFASLSGRWSLRN